MLEHGSFRVHENAAPLKRTFSTAGELTISGFRVHENAAPLKPDWLNAHVQANEVSAFMRTRPH